MNQVLCAQPIIIPFSPMVFRLASSRSRLAPFDARLRAQQYPVDVRMTIRSSVSLWKNLVPGKT
jgi:hypothetical protein